MLEMKKCLTSPFLWLLCICFIILNGMTISWTVGAEEAGGELKKMHDAVLGDVDGNHEAGNVYKRYVASHEQLYDGLSMPGVAQAKMQMASYYPKGEYKAWIERCYQKLQKRVEEIRKTGGDVGGFYPGEIYHIHGALYGGPYGAITKKILTEGIVMMMLAVLFLLDYERVCRSRDVVLVTETGKKIMELKACAGILCGLIVLFLMAAATYGMFFYRVSFKGLWQVPVTSAIVAEPRYMMLYPFITFWKMTQLQYFICSTLLVTILVVLSGAIATGIYDILQNGYLAFLVECVAFFLCILLVSFRTQTFADVVLMLLNPAVLWMECGFWFMENSFSLAFKGNEIAGLLCLMIMTLILLHIGKKSYLERDVL